MNEPALYAEAHHDMRPTAVCVHIGYSKVSASLSFFKKGFHLSAVCERGFRYILFKANKISESKLKQNTKTFLHTGNY